MSSEWILTKSEMIGLYDPNKEQCDNPELNHFGVGMIIVSQNHPHEILMIQERRSDQDLGTINGTWSIPAGHIQSNECPAKAGFRESREEAGVCLHSMELVGKYYVQNAMGYVYVCTINCEPDLSQIDSSEISDVQWIPIAKILSGKIPLRPGVKEVLLSFIND